jgi:phage FluMu protein Com
MEILRSFNVKVPEKYEYECPKCKCLFRFTISDGAKFNDPRGDGFLKINCPECKKSLIVDISTKHKHDRRN